ncbi:MAG TPA: hypothetical protein ENN09_07245, partial [Planctomycetes bacterium]|nr:hypothetical protein [Planctomycetota bacterium]
MKRFALGLGVVLVSAGCGSAVSNGNSLVPMPVGTLPATRSALSLPAAGGGSDYRNLPEIAVSRYSDADATVLTINYRLYFESVDNGQTPIGLHDYLQHPNMAQAGLIDTEGDTFVTFGGRYNVTDIVPVTAELQFGDDYSSISIGADYYIEQDFSAGLRLTFLGIGDVDVHVIY